MNDERRVVPEGATLADALVMAEAPETGIATALNGVVVAADKRATTPLKDGDKVLILKAFFGG